MAHEEINSEVKTQRWPGVMSPTNEHIHRAKLDMHVAQFFLGMKFTQNGAHKLKQNERRRIDGFKTWPYQNSTDQVGPD